MYVQNVTNHNVPENIIPGETNVVNNDVKKQWLDQNGWQYKQAYVQDIKGQIYGVTLNIANAHDGRKILYALSNIKKVDDGVVPSASVEEGLARKHQLSNDTIPQNDPTVKQGNDGKKQWFVPGEPEDSLDKNSADVVKSNQNSTQDTVEMGYEVDEFIKTQSHRRTQANDFGVDGFRNFKRHYRTSTISLPEGTGYTEPDGLYNRAGRQGAGTDEVASFGVSDERIEEGINDSKKQGWNLKG